MKNRSTLNNMLKVIVGQSEDVDSLDAITEIIESCNEQASDELPKAGILFCAVDFEYEIILDEINKAYPNIELIGCTTDGEMSSSEGFLEDSVTLTLFYTDTIEIKASIGRALSEDVKKSVSDAITDVKDKLSEKAKFCIVTPESLTVNNVEVLERIKDGFSSSFPIFGGLAGDQWQMKETFQFFKTELLSDSLPILVFAGPVYFSSGLASGWNPIGNKKKVTKVENNVVYELDNKPILDFYNHYLGSYSKISSEYALAVFPENEKEFYLRSPAASDSETKSIAFFGDIPENATVQLTECTSTGIVNASQTAIESAISNYDNDRPPATALVFSCATRKQLLGINTYKEMDLLRHFLPDCCSINGFYTYGEIAPMSRNNESRFHNSTILTVLIGEEKLEKQIRKLDKKLARSEDNRRILQEIKDKNQELLNRLHAEINESNEMVEKRNEELSRLNLELSKEKEKSEKLLLNILPIRVATDLKNTGTTQPKHFENVTVYFSDIVGFTRISSKLEPKYLIEELNEIFTAFDTIIEHNECERIKTIGDAYMAVSGMHIPSEKHAEQIVTSAIQIVKYLKKRSWSNPLVDWKIRIGIHTGPIIGGVVGVKKYIYDVFGDTVNISARMEENSEEMMINVSEATYELVKNKFECIERDPIEVKGKGLMKMWYIKI